MTTHPTIVPLPNREPTGHGSTELVLVLGVAAFVLGVGMVSQGVVLAQPPAHLLPTTHAVLGGVEPLVPAGDDRPVAVTPLADLVPLTPGTSPASHGGTQPVAVCPPRRALECDLRLELMELALQQRGLFLGRPVAPSEQAVPRKYCVLPRTEGSLAPAAASPPASPQPQDPGC